MRPYLKKEKEGGRKRKTRKTGEEGEREGGRVREERRERMLDMVVHAYKSSTQEAEIGRLLD